MARFGFCSASYSSQSPNADNEICRNFILEAIEGQGKSAFALYPTPGLKLFCALGDTPHRGSYTINGRSFFVAGQTLFEVMVDGSNQNRGNVGSDGLPVTFAANPKQLMVCSNGNLFLLTLATNVLTPIALTGPVARVGYSDSFFTALLQNSQLLQASNPLDGSTWDPLSKGQVSVIPDNILSDLIDHREWWLFGVTKTVVYADYGASPFPFLPINGAVIEQGIAAPASPVRMDNSIFWLGADDRGQGIAWRANGYIPQRVSNHAVEYRWSTYPKISDAVGWTYQDGGHTFWVLLFPSANVTWVYDAATGQWHERAYLSNGVQNAHLGISHTFNFGKHLVGDRQSGNVYDMSLNYFDDNGSPILRTRRAPHISNEQKWIFHKSLQIDLEPGIGINPAQAGQSTNPQFAVLPDDQGNSWQISVNDDGTLKITATNQASSLIVLSDSVVAGVAYQLKVVTNQSGQQILETFPYAYLPGYAQSLNLATPTFQDGLIFVQNGLLETEIIPVTREPQVSLRWSNDGGHTFGNELFVGAGKIGEYKKRIIWRRLGRSRDRVYEMNVSDPIPWRIVDSYLDAEPGYGSPTERIANNLRKQA